MIILLVLPLSLVSCDKDDKDEEPKENTDMSGLGNNGGSPTGSKFQFPQGIELIGEISGNYTYSYPELYSATIVSTYKKTNLQTKAAYTKSDAVEANVYQGSGGLVTVVFQLKNTRSQAVQVVFPAGLLVESVSGAYQNGLLVKKTTVTIPANDILNVVINMYCCNSDRDASDSDAVYKWPIITNNIELHKLFEAAKNKKINVEEYATSQMTVSFELAAIVQDVVWEITEKTEGFRDCKVNCVKE